MKTSTLISTLRKLFTWLYGLQLLLIVVVPLLLVLALWGLPKWQLSKYELPKDGSRIIYATGSDKPTYNRSTGNTYGSTYQNDTLISRHESRGDSMYTYNAKGRLLRVSVLEQQEQTVASDRVNTKPAIDAQNKADSAYAHRNEREIDSILRADPTVYILRKGRSYERIGRSFSTNITMNLHGEAHSSSYNPAPVYRPVNQPKPLNYPLSDSHPIKLTDRPFGSANHQIVFTIHTLADHLAIPLPVLIWQICRSLFSVILLLITRQFVFIFTDLENGEIFSGIQIRRIIRIGTYFIAYALATVAIDISEVIIAHWYVGQHYLDSSFSGPLVIGDIPETGMLLVVGLSLLVLARVFQYGLRLKQDQDLTI